MTEHKPSCEARTPRDRPEAYCTCNDVPDATTPTPIKNDTVPSFASGVRRAVLSNPNTESGNDQLRRELIAMTAAYLRPTTPTTAQDERAARDRALEELTAWKGWLLKQQTVCLSSETIATIEAALASPDDALSQEEWQPMETAPRDGTEVLLWWCVEHGSECVEYWASGQWKEFGDGSKGWVGESFRSVPSGYWTRLICERPTHWRPILTSPAKLRRLRPVVPGERNEQQNDEARVGTMGNSTHSPTAPTD